MCIAQLQHGHNSQQQRDALTQSHLGHTLDFLAALVKAFLYHPIPWLSRFVSSVVWPL